MNKLLIPTLLAIIISIFFVFSCSDEAAIQKTISDFESAVNSNNLDALQATISPYSDWAITQVQSEILSHLYGTYTPLSYTNFSISVSSPWADVTSTAKYYATGDTTAWFKMRKNDGFFSFLNPEWKIKEFYDLDDPDTPIWKKLQ
ncbi:MAG: hypothetical protein JSV25_13735 [Spirochaetota bacterium]|nr:MAG: hypothetical protein JSV25_13735 [Spirochaetota bacterium]